MRNLLIFAALLTLTACQSAPLTPAAAEVVRVVNTTDTLQVIEIDHDLISASIGVYPHDHFEFEADKQGCIRLEGQPRYQLQAGQGVTILLTEDGLQAPATPLSHC